MTKRLDTLPDSTNVGAIRLPDRLNHGCRKTIGEGVSVEPYRHPIIRPVNLPQPAPIAPSLDGRRFVMESSSNSKVDPKSPSRFLYYERDGVIWGDYDGDTVTFGRFVGTRAGNALSVSFVHVMASDGRVVSGTSGSVVEATTDGLRLVESFRIGDVEHVSICVEV